VKLVVFNFSGTIFMQVPDDSTDDASKVEAEKAARHILVEDVENSESGVCSVHQVELGPFDFSEIISI
jgi:hypothetical protein